MKSYQSDWILPADSISIQQHEAQHLYGQQSTHGTWLRHVARSTLTFGPALGFIVFHVAGFVWTRFCIGTSLATRLVGKGM